MITVDSSLSQATGGRVPASHSSVYDVLITQGLLPLLSPTSPPPSPGELTPRKIAEDAARLRTSLPKTNEELLFFSPQGAPIRVPADLQGGVPIGDHVLNFDQLGRGIFDPPLPTIVDAIRGIFQDDTYTYTGSDMRIMLEIAGRHLWNQRLSLRLSKQIVECTTLTVSVHREKAPVRACGYINPKAFARGKRTIAGTLVLTQFTADILLRFLSAVLTNDLSKDTNYVKMDQLPPVNLTLLFNDEHGHASFRRLLGVEFLTDGTVYSTNDMITEQTVSYVASDFTPLMPLTFGVFLDTTRGIPSASWERTVWDVLRRLPVS